MFNRIIVINMKKSRRLASRLRYISLVRLLTPLILLILLLGSSQTQRVLAASGCPTGMSPADCSAIYGPWVDWDPSGAVCGGSEGSFSSVPQTGPVYVVGDSYSVGMKSAGLEKALLDSGYSDVKIDASTGRSINGSGSDGNKLSGLGALNADSTYLQTASVVVVVLGTNPNSPDYSKAIPNFIERLNDLSPSASILWVNIGNKEQSASYIKNTNDAIAKNANNYGFTVVDWYTKFQNNRSLVDGLHPTAQGYETLVNTTIDTLASSNSATPPSAQDNSNIPYKLPATSGPTGFEQAIDENGQITQADNNGSQGHVTFSKFAKLGEAYRDYYITMRWTYASWNWQGSSKIVDSKQLAWMNEKPRIVLVTNKKNGNSIYAAVLESGPGPSIGTKWRADHGNSSSVTSPYWPGYIVGTPAGYDGIVSGFPPKAIDALDARPGYNQDGDELVYQWAPNQDVTPGPANESASDSGDCTDSYSGFAGTAGANGWDISGPNAMITYEQYDPKYADHKVRLNNGGYSGTIAGCGCGPTSMAMAIATLTGDKSVTPITVADYYWTHGGLSGNCGSTWVWSNLSKKWPIKVRAIGTNLNEAIQTVKSGGFVLVSYTGVPFTSLSHPDSPSRHLFLIRGVTNNGNILIANPLGAHAGSGYANQNTTEWDPKYFSPQVNDKGGHLNTMWAVTKD